MTPEPTVSADVRALLDSARVELRRRLQAGQLCRSEELLASCPALASDTEAAVELIIAEFDARRALGERLDVSEWLARFPQWRDRLEHVLPRLDGAASTDETAAYTGTYAVSTAVPGTVAPLGPHEIYEEIGRGGMGVVYRARDLALGREVALKCIRSVLFGDLEVERFYREARSAALLRHPHIVPIYAIGLYEGAPCYTMPLIGGGTLSGQMDRCRDQPRIAVALLTKVARAVDAAHRAGVIHRDLKPGNILIDEHGEPLVADFGLAKLADADPHMTRTGQVVGTPVFMAPEQFSGGSEPIRAATDVWALGVILYLAVVGERPFKGQGRQLEEQILHAEPSWPRRLPRGLGAIVLKCLEKAPAHRYPSAARLADDLEAWRDGRPTLARPPRGVRRLLHAARRYPRLTATFAVTLLAAFTVSVLAYVLHPDRPLWQLQADFRERGELELIGEAGAPRWHRFWMGGTDAKAFVGDDGTFTVHGWPLTLLELFPDTQGHASYHLHAEVRHTRGGDNGVVGLYFAGTTKRVATFDVLTLLQVSYDDLHDVVDLFNRFPPEARAKMVAPKQNSVRTLVQVYASQPKQEFANLHNATLLDRPLFRPWALSSKPDNWRKIRVEVSPGKFHIYWGDKSVGVLDPARVEGTLQQSLGPHLAPETHAAALKEFVPRLDGQGGFGLYLFESYASFRNVRIEARAATSSNP